ncbi:MAG: hypothetical protein K9W46_07780 [Candidatus Heimdallarchaeum endolithica]|uniref:Uncharacterized protein n=1 Tax=Candidatus Heimdallarchaeum endolithica TaxID=2876572 RepID=A0A9Y1BNK0_9ARCH|nr:MAG: hypothetical protein K9W46_07780 [Candidatus Heimdallarchaeum endolithica]
MSQLNVEKTDSSEETKLGPRTEKEVWQDWGKSILSWLGDKIHSPMGVWFISIWLVSIITMCITNSLRGEPFFKGPSYWIGVFLTYGLNVGQDPSYRFIAKPVVNWIFAPMVVITLGITLFILPDCGFFRNGAFPKEELDFQKTYMFFNTDVWGSNLVNPDHPKWTVMYLWIVWMPVFLGTAITSIYNYIVFKRIKKRKRTIPKPTKTLLYSLISTFIVGVAMALMTGNIELRFRGILRSVFIERKTNSFFIYGTQYNLSGQYHPIGLALTMWLINLLPFALVYMMFLITMNIDKIWINRKKIVENIKTKIKREKVGDLFHEQQKINQN